jgi:hypothetical protein
MSAAPPFHIRARWFDRQWGAGSLDIEKGKGVNRRLEFQLRAWFVSPRGFVLVLSTARALEHGLSPFGRANLNPRRNPLDRQR